MVKQIRWSENALQDRLQILEYWFQRIGNKNYSNYLDSSFRATIQVLIRFPQIGRVYKDTTIRFIVKDNYLLFYEYNNNNISIIGIFDTRRNPEILNDKL